MILLDTNVLSELVRPEPAAGVLAWLSRQRREAVGTTSITQAEMLVGVGVLPAGRRKQQLEGAVQALFRDDFAGRVFAFDAASALHYAAIAAERRRRGRPISHPDAQIAAIARSHRCELATRNGADFEHCGVALVDPWTFRD